MTAAVWFVHRVAKGWLRQIGAFVLVSGLSVPGFVAAQQPPSVEALERLASVFTERHPGVDTVTLRNEFNFGGGSGPRVRQLLWYSSSGRYAFLRGIAGDRAAQTASDESRSVIYDAERGRLLLVQGMVQNTVIQSKDRSYDVNWNFSNADKPGRDPLLRIDFPSFLRHPEVVRRDVEQLGGGRYRLAHTTGTRGRLLATIEPSVPFSFTGIEIYGGSGSRVFVLDLQLNRERPIPAFAVPPVTALREHFEIEEIPYPQGMPALLSLMGMLMQPLGFGGDAGNPARAAVDGMLSRKHDWSDLAERYRRDLPRLRKAMPMPD